MIRVIPEWLQEAIDFINQEFPNDEDVRITIMYGWERFPWDDGIESWAFYDADIKAIFLADFSEIKEKNNLYTAEAIDLSIEYLFHEYRHHQQNIYHLDMSEDDAENFATETTSKFNLWLFNRYRTNN